MSAESRLLAGLSAYTRGEFREAAQYCSDALDRDAPSDALTVRLIHLHLIATELWWFLDPTEDVGELVGRALTAAARTGDFALAAMACCMHGRYLIASNGLSEGIAVFSEAADLAAKSGNLLVELETLSDFGHHSVGRSMERGISILRRAQVRAERSADDGTAIYDRPLLPVCRARLKGLIGVAVFDNGYFEEAESWLRHSIDELRALKSWHLFASISNYLGQLLTEMGRFEEAEDVLLKALELLRTDADLSTFQGYNMGLLGKLYLEWDRIGDAEECLKAGWDRLQRTRHRAILPILRNYLGELIMHRSYSANDVKYARQLFDETIVECHQSGFQRSEIAALTLSALACLAMGDNDGAVAASTEATARLEAVGTMPALRTEEVYLVRHQVLKSIDAKTEAEEALARARRVLLSKAATIGDPLLREQFLTRVRTSQIIMSASQLLRYSKRR
jgi:tetratricopeptide (TPR) repeat protein